MAQFFDDFERADGALGGNWTTVIGVPTIVGGNVQYNGTWTAYDSTVSSTGRHEATAHVFFGSTNGIYAGPVVKITAGSVGGFSLMFTTVTSTPTLAIVGGYNHSYSVIASVTLGSKPPPYCELRLVWDNGHLSGYCNDALELEVDNSNYPGGNYCGICGRYTAAAVADARFTVGTTVGLSADPDVVGNYGECTDIDLTGVGTSWTAGTPGSPTFTVDHGTISAQTVVDATHATITYCPGDYLGSATITDPSTGETVGIVVTSDPAIIPPEGPCPLTQEGADLLNDEAELRPGGHVLTDLTPSLMDPPETIVQLITWMYLYIRGIVGGVPPEDPAGGILGNIQNVLAGGWTPDPMAFEPLTTTPVKSDTEWTAARLLTLTGTYTDLATLVQLLGGTPTIYSNADLMTAIGNIPPAGDNQDVLDMLTAMWGTETPTLTQIAALVSDISTVAGYDLSDVLDAIAAIPSGDNSGQITASTTAILGAIAALALEVAGVAAEVTADLASDTASAAGLVALAASMAEFAVTALGLLNELKALLSGGSQLRTAPVWPGHSHVTFGATYNLATTVNIDGPMHGINIDITSTEPGTSYMQYDQVKAWRHVGGLVFYNDDGYCETYQALGFGKAVYVPKTMAVAQGVRFYKSHLPQGTVVPWTITS